MSTPTRRIPIFKPAWAPKVPARAALARSTQAFGPKRPGGRARGYDDAWMELRDAVLQSEPMCRACALQGVTRRASVVDHIRPVDTYPELRLDPANLRRQILHPNQPLQLVLPEELAPVAKALTSRRARQSDSAREFQAHLQDGVSWSA